jgi:hypothetical protein
MLLEAGRIGRSSGECRGNGFALAYVALALPGISDVRPFGKARPDTGGNEMIWFARSTSERSRRVLRYALALLLGVLSASSPRAPLAQTQSPQTLDDLFSAVAARVPEFGGMFLSDPSTGAQNPASFGGPILNVYLTRVNLLRVVAVRSAILAVFGPEAIPPGPIVLLHGNFGFAQLRDWYTRLVNEVFSIPGVTMTDIDETNNRLLIGIDNEQIGADIFQLISKLGIPVAAAEVEVIKFQAQTTINSAASDTQDSQQLLSVTLDNRAIPTQGGYQIHPVLPNRTHCTLGFNATRGGGMRDLSPQVGVLTFIGEWMIRLFTNPLPQYKM